MKTGNIIAIAGIGYVLYEIGKEKYNDFSLGFKDSLDMIEYEIQGVSNVDISFSQKPKVTFNMDLKVINPSETDFTASGGGLINLKKIDVLSQSYNLLATVKPNMTELDLPPNGSTVLEDLPVEIPVSKLGNLLDSFITGLDVDKNQFNLRLKVVVAGNEFVID